MNIALPFFEKEAPANGRVESQGMPIGIRRTD
jgi:hypothetical protein